MGNIIVCVEKKDTLCVEVEVKSYNVKLEGYLYTDAYISKIIGK